ncbi:FecCD family ABC transporter permease [Streptomyces qinzhouensis]|uniref:FecCD family ABC transporter permease n=1 Tax=Streptomyces qinzhouensis TaxID=2599401 RepID=UPI001FECC1AC|nr:iron ABC transporter permease [Streptomyces qinzhouensis]
MTSAAQGAAGAGDSGGPPPTRGGPAGPPPPPPPLKGLRQREGRRPGAAPASSRLRFGAVTAGLLAALAAAVLAALALGSVRIPPREVVAALLPGAEPSPFRTIVLDVRLPRVLLGLAVGAGLGVVGTVLQALVRNRLADPFLLGISSGASTGAVLVLVLGIGATTAVALPAGAFAGSLAAFLLVYGLARNGGGMTGTRLVLAGVTISYVFTALTTLVLVASSRPEHFREALYWSLGGLGSARWDTVWLPAVVVGLALPLLLALARPLDLLLVGEEGAIVLGLDVARFRAAVFVLVSLVTAVLVAASGAVGFIGLMVPHAARLLVGAAHRALLPVAALGGAVALVVADLAARTVAAPQDVPVGVLTALIGGPLFLWLMRRRSVDGTEGAPA